MKHPGLRGAFWPSPTQEGLIRVTLGPPAEAAAGWRELQPIDIQALEPGSFCLLPLLYERLSEIVPADDRLPLLRGTCRSNWLRNQLLIERIATLFPRLAALEIEPLVLGGPAIVTRWYSGLGSRPVPQLELAVDLTRGAAAADAAQADGWQAVGGDGVHRWFIDGDRRRLVLHEGMPPLVSGPLGRGGALHELRARAEWLTVLDVPLLVLQPADEFVIACGLGARTTIPPTIQWLLDAAKALTAPDRPDPNDLLARARRYRVVEPVRDTITYLARFAAVELDGYVEAFSTEPVSRRESVAYRVSGLGAGAFVGLPLLLASGLRATSELPARRALAGLPRQVQEAWGATSLRQTAAFAMRKLLRLVARRRRTHAAAHQAVPVSTVGRNRSASS